MSSSTHRDDHMISLHTHSIRVLVDQYFADTSMSFEALVRNVKNAHGDTPETLKHLDHILYS